jgi:hypothetical protein
MVDATGLYYAVDAAIDTLIAAPVLNDLDNAVIVTFTDGLDNYSVEYSDAKYRTPNAYRDAVKDRIRSTKIKGFDINAYCIGVKGNDVRDEMGFDAGLEAMASNAANVMRVTNMNEANAKFVDIANDLYNESRSQNLQLGLRGGIEPAKIRFTFDNIAEAADSNFYIEGDYDSASNPRKLNNIVYQGLSSSTGTTINATQESGYTIFTFENVTTNSGENIIPGNTKQWIYISYSSIWERASEFNPADQMKTEVKTKSAIIMLVLDCTTSLGADDFSEMKSAANNFIDILLSGGGNPGGNPGGGGSGTGTRTNPITLSANVWANGNIPTPSSEQWFKFTATASTQYIHFSFGTLTDLDFEAFTSSFTSFGDALNMYGSYTMVNLTNLSNGQVYYFKITPYYNYYSGTYRVAFSTSTTAPPQ